MSDEKIVQLRGVSKLPEQTFTVEKPPFGFCQHTKITLDTHLRTVNCTQCKKVIDPFSFLLEEARLIQSAWDNHRIAKAQLHQLGERIAELQKEEKRLKARINTAREKADSVVDYRTPRQL